MTDGEKSDQVCVFNHGFLGEHGKCTDCLNYNIRGFISEIRGIRGK
jgi:cephalosporin-C deacetylase-like acetyl esterase